MLNYLRTNAFIEPKSAQDRAELLLEAEYYQIISLIKQLKNESVTSTTTVEKLLFDSTLHHPQVIISENGLKATYTGVCAKFLYAKISNVLWENGRHYWEVTLLTQVGNVSFVHDHERSIVNILLIFEVVTHQWVSLRLLGIQTNV